MTCALKPDCPRLAAGGRTLDLTLKYGGRVPRYTSYPTAAHFTADIGEADHRRWLATLDGRAPLSLYVHVPFCERLCWYCGCHTAVARRRASIESYVRTLVREIAIATEAMPPGLAAAALHLGGGTPNMLAPDDLRAILGALRERLALTPSFGFAAELDPRNLTGEWIDAAVGLGLNRASLGVQDLDADVQRAINRIQPYADVERAATRLRAAGVRSVNLDLMYGLPRQSVAGILATVDQVLALRPERIALFGYAHVPWMKPHQKLLPEASLPGVAERFEQQCAAAEWLEKAGYVRIGLDHFARPDDALAIAARNGALRRNFQGYTAEPEAPLLGFGPSAISALPAGYAQNAARVPDWQKRIEAGRLATARGLALTPDDRVRAAIIERIMCDLRVDLARICAALGRPLTSFAPALFRLRGMEADGLVTRRGAVLDVTRRGRPFVRTIAAAFDPSHDPLGSGRHAPSV